MKFGIVFGGQSYEHEISIVSAITLKDVINSEVAYVFCDKDREFYLIEAKDMKATYFSSGGYKKAKKLNIKQGGFYTEGMFSKKVEAEAYINLIHGCDGEDGKLSALFEFFDIKFIGSRLEAAALSYDKVLTKFLAEVTGVKTLPHQVLRRGDALKLELPIILKPARLGSSIGIEIVKDKNELEYALDKAFEYDDIILAEPFFEGIKEYNLAGCKIDGEIKFSIVEEPNKSDEILDFDQKYLSFSGSSKIRKADIGEELESKLQEAFSKLYNYGFDGSIPRCDFFVKDGEVYLNEINTNPGSLAYYLFDDFNDVINSLANSLPEYQKIPVGYEYIQSISVHK
ncbi:MAG: D-alanine--D-alanine ligase [Campylobacteraceae bacterium]|mgnify:CR=1 FL=1|nr:D-alanine--D-alanine ligase [Campylobacteraceae bacterium]